MTRDDILNQIVDHYGAEHQKRKAIEELVELTEAIIKDMNKKDYERTSIVEEIADSLVMIWQLQIIYDISYGELYEWIDEKLRRVMRDVRRENKFDKLIDDYNNSKHEC